jgi:hypothetical protein
MVENYVTGISKCPESSKVVLCILIAYIPPPRWNRHIRNKASGEEGAMLFAQSNDNSWKKNITCHNCGKKGHLAWECHSKSGCEKGEGEKKD